MSNIDATSYSTYPPASTEVSNNNSDDNNSGNRKQTCQHNSALEAYKQAGLQQLEEISQVIVRKAHKSLLSSAAEEKDSAKPSVKQLRLASALLGVMEDIVELYCAKEPVLCLNGEPFEITNVEVSPDLRYAQVYWTLPVTMEGKPVAQVRVATEYIQRLLEEEKHGKKIQHYVAGRLHRFRFVPKLRFVPEDTDLTHSDLVLNKRRRHR